MNGLSWHVATPALPGAIAVIQIDGEVAAACAALGLPPVAVGEVRLRELLGVDRGVVVAWSSSCLHLMPHGGVAVGRAIGEELERRGIAHTTPTDPRVAYPEAADELEADMLAALARAASPAAIELLLGQPRRWKASSASDPDRDRVLNRLLDPPLVVALGPPNVGKSTLVNALARRQVSIVADVPGTTRDHVGVTLDLEGVTVGYIDTPGLTGWPSGSLTGGGAEALVPDLVRQAALVIVCVDQTAPTFAYQASDAQPVIRVNLRSDLGRVPADLAVSVNRGAGLAELAAAMREALVPAAALAHPGPWRFWERRGLN